MKAPTCRGCLINAQCGDCGCWPRAQLGTAVALFVRRRRPAEGCTRESPQPAACDAMRAAGCNIRCALQQQQQLALAAATAFTPCLAVGHARDVDAVIRQGAIVQEGQLAGAARGGVTGRERLRLLGICSGTDARRGMGWGGAGWQMLKSLAAVSSQSWALTLPGATQPALPDSPRMGAMRQE